jgi:UDP-N-acetylglucosamine diphosphorylase/glucosamine-1-phosphate N-acetyltransferase
VTLQVIILAAGKGTRMKSDLAKVAHPILGRPMVDYVLDAAQKIGSDHTYLVIGHQADRIREMTREYNVIYVEQKEQLGTGHAVMMVKPLLRSNEGTTVILCGDVPLLKVATINELLEQHRQGGNSATILTIKLRDPKHYGRIIREKNGDVQKIVEYRDATGAERAVNEINTGIYAFATADLFSAIDLLRPENDQKEYYLTDVIEILKKQAKKIGAFLTDNELEVHGINDVNDLERAETELKHVPA